MPQGDSEYQLSVLSERHDNLQHQGPCQTELVALRRRSQRKAYTKSFHHRVKSVASHPVGAISSFGGRSM
jgi:hypothetical protein